MKKIFTFLGAISLASLSLAQTNVNNPSFENWENVVVKDSIEFWTTSTSDMQNSGNITINNTYQTGNAKNGNYAMHMETIVFDNNGSNDTIFGYCVKENVNNGFEAFPYNSQVNEFKGWYKCNTVNNDSAFVLVQLFLGGTLFDAGLFPMVGNVSSWTEFSIPLNNGNVLTPDSVFVGFVSSHFQNSTVVEPGSWLEVDSVGFAFNGVGATPLPNFSFESLIQETIEQPTDWWSFDQSFYNQTGNTYVTKSTDTQDGVSSMRIETTPELVNLNIPALVSNGTFDFGIGWFVDGEPFNAQPDTFSVKYKYTPSGIDTAYVLVESWNANGSQVDTTDMLPNTTWSTHNIELSFTEAPDSMRISFYSGDNVGSVLLIDDIQFIGGDLGFNDSELLEWSMYPNPATNEFTLTNVNNAQIEIYDLNGKLVYNNQVSNYQINVSTLDWQNGIYLVKIISNNLVQTKKLVIKH